MVGARNLPRKPSLQRPPVLLLGVLALCLAGATTRASENGLGSEDLLSPADHNERQAPERNRKVQLDSPVARAEEASPSTRSIRASLSRIFEKWGPPPGSEAHLKCAQYIDGFSVDPVTERKTMSFTAQCSEDWFLLGFFLDFEKYLERPGHYVDCAAHHYSAKSNTFFLDSCLGWKGSCIEANPKYIEGLRSNRTCDVVDTCVSDKRETVSFVLSAGTSGISNSDYRFKTGNKPEISLDCITFQDAMARSPGIEPSAPGGARHIDFMSLDVEGNEARVLGGIDFKKTTFGVILVEVASGPPGEKIKKKLLANGYKPQATISGSYVFTRDDYPGAKVEEAREWSCGCRGCKHLPEPSAIGEKQRVGQRF